MPATLTSERRSVTPQMLAARERLQTGASLMQATLAAGLTSIHQFSWRYYRHFGHWPTQDLQPLHECLPG
jgi:methylphosphotriester-DNA--protein-cysteine methyltransferase